MAIEQDESSLFVNMGGANSEIVFVPIFDKQIRWCLKNKNATTLIVRKEKNNQVDKILKYTNELVKIDYKLLSPSDFISLSDKSDIFSIVVIDDGI